MEIDMKKRILHYERIIDDDLSGKTPVKSWRVLAQDHLIQIGFFQHERLIHLMVTLLFALLAVLTFFVILITENLTLLAVFFLTMVLLIPYIKHYFLMENKVQKMYAQYDEILERAKAEEEAQKNGNNAG